MGRSNQRVLTTHPVHPDSMTIVNPITSAPTLESQAQARSDGRGIVTACTTGAVTLTLYYWCTRQAKWFLADITVALSGRACDALGTANWLVPAGTKICIIASGATTISIGGIDSADGQIIGT